MRIAFKWKDLELNVLVERPITALKYAKKKMRITTLTHAHLLSNLTSVRWTSANFKTTQQGAFLVFRTWETHAIWTVPFNVSAILSCWDITYWACDLGRKLILSTHLDLKAWSSRGLLRFSIIFGQNKSPKPTTVLPIGQNTSRKQLEMRINYSVEATSKIQWNSSIGCLTPFTRTWIE